MASAGSRREHVLDLSSGDLVEVKSKDEILATLDPSGALDGLPFMPEMLAFCGRRFRVAKRSDKTCDTITYTGLRRMRDTVHLDGTRCDGSAHGACQADCQIFWKEAWLKQIPDPAGGNGSRPETRGVTSGDRPRAATSACTEGRLFESTLRAPESGATEPAYRCQATELLAASEPLSWWAPAQYLRDVRSGNAGIGDVLGTLCWMGTRWARTHLRGYRIQVWLFNLVQRLRGRVSLEDIDVVGSRVRTPAERLNLVPGELVQVKSAAEIRDTLNVESRNRGLYFDREMTPYCGGTYAIRRRVNRIIEEKTGRMITLPGDCVILENVICTGRYHASCPRAIYPYWREIWLRRASARTRVPEVTLQSCDPGPGD